VDFVDAVKKSKHPGDDCIRYLLVWMAAVDGDVHEDEQEWLAENLNNRSGSIPVDQLVRAVQEGDVSYEIAALSALRRALDEQGRELILELAIGVARADGRVMHSEVHALRLISDALQISPSRFASLYRSETNTDPPELADLSDPAFWERAERVAREREAAGSNGSTPENQGGRPNSPKTEELDARTREALATLGLDASANSIEIKDAYRRLAAVHHPDRFSSLGDSATVAATKTFQRIKAAYDHLATARARA